MPKFIDAEDLEQAIKEYGKGKIDAGNKELDVVDGIGEIVKLIDTVPEHDVEEVVRCRDCEYCTELDPHCDINRESYFHCTMWRGDETKNVWHKYGKYYKDYSIVLPNEFCSNGARRMK